jgi:hypothetical protein
MGKEARRVASGAKIGRCDLRSLNPQAREPQLDCAGEVERDSGVSGK